MTDQNLPRIAIERSPFDGKLWLVIIGILALIIFFAMLKSLVIVEELETLSDDNTPDPPKEAPKVSPSPPAQIASPRPVPAEPEPKPASPAPNPPIDPTPSPPSDDPAE